MNKFGLHTFGLPSFGLSDFRLTSFGGDGDGGRKAALPSPDLYYDLSLKSNEHPTRNIIDDMSGNGRHATIYNALYAEGSGYGKYAYEGAFVFDGIDDYARIENITKGFKTLFMEVVPFKTGGILFGQRMMDAVQVGGRNLVEDSAKTIVSTTLYNLTKTYQQLKGKTITVSFEYEYENVSTGPDLYSRRFGFERGLMKPDGTEDYLANWVYLPESSSGLNGSGRAINTLTVPSDHTNTLSTARIYTQVAGGTVRVWNFKIEEGNKATDWTPAPEDVFAISNLPNTIAYNERNPNGVTYINGELNTNKYTDDMQNHRQVITIVNPTDTTHGSASIGAAFDFSEDYSSMALYKIIGFYDELTPEQIQKVITKYNLKYEQI